MLTAAALSGSASQARLFSARHYHPPASRVCLVTTAPPGPVSATGYDMAAAFMPLWLNAVLAVFPRGRRASAESGISGQLELIMAGRRTLWRHC